MSEMRRGGVDRATFLSGGAGTPIILAGTVDPTVGAGVPADEGSIFLRYVAGTGTFYAKTGAADTAWTIMRSASRLASRIVFVSAVDGDAATIAAGLSIASTMLPPPSGAAPVSVIVGPGVYAEGPLTVPTGVVLSSINPSQYTATIVATTTTSPLLTVSPGAEARGFIVTGASGLGGEGVRVSSAGGSPAILRELIVTNCTTAFHVTGAGVEANGAFLTARKAVGESLEAAFAVDGGAVLEGAVLLARGDPADHIATGVSASGAGSRLTASPVQANDCDVGVLADASATVEVSGGAAKDNDVALRATGGTLRTFSIAVSGSATSDVDIDATGTWTDAGSVIDPAKRLLAAGATRGAAALAEDPTLGRRALSVLGGLDVGDVGFPASSAFGEGPDHVEGMLVQRSVSLDAGPFTDITAAMISPSGSTASLFDTGAVGNALFIGGDTPFPCFTVDAVTAVALGAGTLVVEISDGVGSWLPVKIAVCDTAPPYLSHAQDVFGRVATERIRLGDTTGWAAQVINGTSKFWVRIRVDVGALTTVPVAEFVRLGTNAARANADGTIELCGSAEVERDLVMHQDLFVDLSGSASGNSTINFSANVDLNLVNNNMANGAVDGAGASTVIPVGLDTSRPMRLAVRWIPKTDPGDVELETNLVRVRLGDTLNGTLTEIGQAIIQTVAAGETNVLKEAVFTFDVSPLEPGDQIAFSLFRDATGGNPDDTLAGSVNIVSASLRGTFWR